MPAVIEYSFTLQWELGLAQGIGLVTCTGHFFLMSRFSQETTGGRRLPRRQYVSFEQKELDVKVYVCQT